MHSPRLAASLASAVFVTAFTTTALAGEPPAPDFEDWDAPPASVGAADRAPTHLAKPKRAPKAQLPAEPQEESWYGYQILLADGALIALAMSKAEWRREDEECARKGRSGQACYGDFGHLREEGAAAVGFAVGLLGASVIDATVLAWEDAPAAKPAPTGLRVAPSLAMVEGGGTLGIAGVF